MCIPTHRNTYFEYKQTKKVQVLTTCSVCFVLFGVLVFHYSKQSTTLNISTDALNPSENTGKRWHLNAKISFETKNFP